MVLIFINTMNNIDCLKYFYDLREIFCNFYVDYQSFKVQDVIVSNHDNVQFHYTANKISKDFV